MPKHKEIAMIWYVHRECSCRSDGTHEQERCFDIDESKEGIFIQSLSRTSFSRCSRSPVPGSKHET